MKHDSGFRRDDSDEEAGEPAGPGGSVPGETAWTSPARASGIRARGVPDPRDDAPCTSFDEAHARYAPFVWVETCRRIDQRDADDVFQKVWIRLDRRIRAEGMPHPLAPELRRFVVDAVRNQVRSRKRRRTDGEPDSDVMPSSKPTPEQQLGLAEEDAARRDRVQATVARLTPAQAEILQLAHVGGLSYADIAAIVGSTVEAVTARLHRARLRFKELYLAPNEFRRRP